MIISALLLAASLAAQSPKMLFDDGWTFTRNGKTVSVDLLHDWDIFEGPNSGKGATGTGGGWFEGGKGEYRKEFTVAICGYVYDPKQNIPPGTPFEELPDDWRCPRCKQPKEKFNPA